MRAHGNAGGRLPLKVCAATNDWPCRLDRVDLELVERCSQNPREFANSRWLGLMVALYARTNQWRLYDPVSSRCSQAR